MSRILLRDLEPGRLYHIQARATNGEQSSQWSQLWDLQTTSDIMPPAAPTGLSWVVEGTAFKAVWTGPTLNQDGSDLRDFKDFQVKIYSPAAPGTIVTYYTTSARFDLPFENNVNSFGTPRAQVTIEVRARDNTGNLSTSATATATNPPPANVTGFTATGITDAISVKWNANADTDLKYYKVWQGTAAGSENTLVYTGLATSFVFDTLSTSPQYFKIVAVDVFNSESATAATASATAKSSLAVDGTPPAAPTGVTVTSALDTSDPSGGRAYIDVSWTGVADTDLQNYSVRYSTGTTWEYIDVPEGVTTARINGLRPNTNYNVAVAAVDYSGNSSAYVNAGTYPILTAKDTTAPAAPTGVTVGAGVTTMTVAWTENTENDVKNGIGTYEVQLDTVNTFNSGNLITKQNSGTIVAFTNLTSNTTYYTRVRAIDATGNAGSYSSIVSGTPRYVANADIQAGTISGDKITAASINGDRVVANTLDANVLKANTTFSQNLNVGSTFTMASSGIMKSSNYVAGVSGWQLTNTTLEINQGTIKAAALQLQNGHNMLHPAYADWEFVKSWYTNNLITFNDGGVSTWAISDATDVTGKYNTQCIKTSWTGVGTFSRTYMGPTYTSYNVQLEANTDYIFSGWVYVKTGAGAKTAALGIKLADATFPGPVANTSIPATSTWTRIWGTFNSGTQTSAELYLSQYTSGDMYWDGLQLEKKVTADTVPSQWKPPGSTSIDGGIIRTGEIRSTAAASGLAGQPAWSINVQGNAQFGDANIRGRLVVGDINNPSADGVNSKIQSANYSVGTSGWIVRNDGYAEFRQLAVNSIKVTAFDSPFQNTANAKLFDYMQDANLWLQSGSVQQKTDPGAYSAESLFEFTGPGLVLRNGTGVKPIAYDPTILYRISARVRAFTVATLNSNGTFEGNNTTGWTVDATNGATIAASNTYASTGTYSMRMTSGASTGASYRAWTNVIVKPGYNYTINAKIKAMIQAAYYNATNYGNIELRVTWFGTSGYLDESIQLITPPIDANGLILTAPTDWFSVGATFTAPALATNANFIIRLARYDNVTSGTVIGYIDDVSVTTPPRIKLGLFGMDNANNFIDYDFIDDATTPTKKHPMPSDYSTLSSFSSSQYMLVADNVEVPIATGGSSTTSDWITLTGYIKGRGGSGATGKFGKSGMFLDEYTPSSFNQEVRFMVPYVEFDTATGSIAQLDQFSIESYESGAVSKIDTTGTTDNAKSVSIENIQDAEQFDHAIRFYTGDSDERNPGLIGHSIDGDENNSPHLRIASPTINKYGNPFIGLWERNPNYIYDGSFSNGISGWAAFGTNTTLSWENNDGYDDNNSLKVAASGTVTTSSEFIAVYDVPINGNPELVGEAIGASAYLKTNGPTRSVKVQVNFLDSAYALVSGWYVQKNISSSWTRYSFITGSTIPDTAAYLRIFIYWTAGATGDVVYVDNVQMEVEGITAYRSASASKILLDSDVTKSRGPIIISETDFDLPPPVIGGLNKPDMPGYKGVVVQTESGTGAMRLVNYTDTNGTRVSWTSSFFSTEGAEESGLVIYGMADGSFPGRMAMRSPNGSWALSTQPSSDGSYPYDVHIHGSLIVDGQLQWVPLTSSAVTPFDAGRALGVAKINNMLVFRGAGSWSGTAGASGTVIFTLPVGYRPSSPQYMCALMWNGNSWSSGVAFHVKTSGECILWSPPEGAGLGTSLSIEGLQMNLSAMPTTSTPGTDTTAPSAPTGFTISAVSSGTSTGSYKLAWTNPSASDTAGVKVIWRSDRYPTVTIAGSGTKTLTTDGTVITVTGSASQAKTYTHSGIPVNRTIYYRVVSYDKSGNHSTYVSASRYLLASPITISPSSSGSYRLGYGGMWRNDGDEVYQGDWTGNDNHRGLYFYGTNIYSKLSTGGVVRTPTKMTIYLKRLSTSHGNNAGVGINLRGHKYQSKPSGDPVGSMTNEGSDGDNIVYLSRGEAATVTIPSSWYNNFVVADPNNTDRLEGLGVYGSSTADYAVLYGKSSGSSYGKLTIYHKG
ncbi:minor tail protein [Streptomyces phage Annadreamy]|uniref:Minor tail protein n=2 Tax=Annadreamyvirus annadreamy TaxID=2846392 RepID=A0A345GT90_9CAUD|nr:minor tail protein [Streptomyces phage Annadreamy]AXG66162.1 minor tail protein [Streptomyces phage Annadreamy]QGH79374.1 minor tail protein [Streptomyces phage Limpid]